MPKLPVVSGRECVAVLQRLGFSITRQRGSHIVMRCGERGCVVPNHREIRAGTLHGLLRQGGVGPEEFIAALK
ncbi:MAG: type II toxin-antitoxin system HicA family toxin [Verrucomicrobiales bacterium]|jgi:predicted RNA binding protein YcfA (HicA-like mRNA interferase family)|nr:type II toxin-antitoxin system HicA family toxin [Verrucomicrobiales bacterium]